jgi:hypothetical protein
VESRNYGPSPETLRMPTGRRPRGIVDIASRGLTGPERSRSRDEREPLNPVKPAGSGVTLKNSSSTLYKACAEPGRHRKYDLRFGSVPFPAFGVLHRRLNEQLQSP